MLWFIMAKNAGKRNFIAYNRSNNWVFVTCYDATATPKETFTEEYCRRLIDQSLGKKIPYNVLSITTWNTTPRVARHYRSKLIRHGFVVGDAAHCFPSTGGLGVNTGLGDAHNLVWKITAVENGWAEDRLLDSYELERIPIAVENSRQSRLNEKKVHELSRAAFGDNGQSLEERMQDPKARSEIQLALMDNYNHFDSLDLQIGYVYGKARSPHRRAGHYIPECIPGTRLPHAWVYTADGRTISTLDVTDYSAFTILLSGSLQRDNRRPLDDVSFPAKEVYLGKDIIDKDGAWTRLMGLERASSAVVIRPDQHVLGRVTTIDELQNLVNSFVLCSSYVPDHEKLCGTDLQILAE
ncbi:FAD binding domain-containing protein [Exophiala viscosa]|uniref:FAD binding domain-containing protein n=1 Tax=Exophiala viscosa TaxID=2486360 RepID=A0AAN6DP48_9EURO|nr:FAD binding domain-containing protein [Exophiala viscosa]